MEIKNTSAIVFPKNIKTTPIELIKIQVKTELEQKQPETQEKITKEVLETRVEGMNEFLEPIKTAVKFQLHEELNEYYVQVINPFTDEIIKEIPNKKFLDMYASMAEFAGLLVDEKL